MYSISNTCRTQTKNRMFAISIIMMLLLDGLRWGVATDWRPYIVFFERSLTADTEGFEIGYVWITRFVRSITDQYTVFLLLEATFNFGVLWWFIKKYSVNKQMSVVLYFATMIPYTGMNRQLIALFICLISVKFLLEKNYKYYFALIIFAMLFHTSAIMFLVAVLLNREFKTRTIYIIFLISITISLTGVINNLPLSFFLQLGDHVGDKATAYMGGDLTSYSITSKISALALRTLYFAILIWMRPKCKKLPYFNLMFNISLVGIIVYMLFVGSILQIIVSRGLLFYNIFQIIYIPLAISKIKRIDYRLIAYLLVIAYSFIVLDKGFNGFSADLKVDIFRPYNSVFENKNYQAQ